MFATIACARLRRPGLDARGLTPTQFSSAEEKARMGDAILSFVARGMPQTGFSKALYTRVSSMWGFIACYNRDGFWTTHLASTGGRVAFLEQITRSPCFGQAAFTWCDVEREIATRIREHRLLEAYRDACARERKGNERRQLATLLARYGSDGAAQPEAGQLGLF